MENELDRLQKNMDKLEALNRLHEKSVKELSDFVGTMDEEDAGDFLVIGQLSHIVITVSALAESISDKTCELMDGVEDLLKKKYATAE